MISLFSIICKYILFKGTEKLQLRNYAFIFSAKPFHFIAFWYMISTKELWIFSNNFRGKMNATCTRPNPLSRSVSQYPFIFFLWDYSDKSRYAFLIWNQIESRDSVSWFDARKGFFIKLDSTYFELYIWYHKLKLAHIFR